MSELPWFSPIPGLQQQLRGAGMKPPAHSSKPLTALVLVPRLRFCICYTCCFLAQIVQSFITRLGYSCCPSRSKPRVTLPA